MSVYFCLNCGRVTDDFCDCTTAYYAISKEYDHADKLREWLDPWHPASKPPPDGKHVLLRRKRICFIGYRTATCGWIINAPLLPTMWPAPTHWRDLPPLPEDET